MIYYYVLTILFQFLLYGLFLHYIDKYDLLNTIVNNEMMEQLSTKLKNVSAAKDTEVLRKFMGMAVLGVIESYVLNQFNAETREIAEQVAALLELIIHSS